jgi:hypothetical protein
MVNEEQQQAVPVPEAAEEQEPAAVAQRRTAWERLCEALSTRRLLLAVVGIPGGALLGLGSELCLVWACEVCQVQLHELRHIDSLVLVCLCACTLYACTLCSV